VHIPFSTTIRSIGRARQILQVLIRYGFGEVVHELQGVPGIGVIRGRRAKETAKLSDAARARKAIEDLGPTFIKMGQIASTRPDLIPANWIEELKKLQSDVPPVPWEKVKVELEREFDGRMEEVFESIDEKPLAAASMAQTHRGVLKDGTPVVIKILRPGIRDLVETDMEILGALATLADRHLPDKGYNASEVVAQLSVQMRREADLWLELRSCERMARDFTEYDNIRFPKVFRKASTRGVLTMEEVQGRLLAKLDLESLPADERRKIAETGADAVFHQCLDIGFFHADPHPGNIFILEGGGICFIDCGMTGSIDPETTNALASLVHGVVRKDLERVVRVAVELGRADRALARDRAFRADVWDFIGHFDVQSFDEFRLGDVLQDFYGVLRKWRMICPADLVYLIKAISTIEGVAETVDPTFDIVSFVQPKVEHLVRRRFGIRAVRRRFESALIGYTGLVEDLPEMARDLAETINQKKIRIEMEHSGTRPLIEAIDAGSVTVVYGLIMASLIVGSSVLILADNVDREPGWISLIAAGGFISALVLGLLRLISKHVWNR
jgi:ubiquinone biosynthesis protein